MTCQRCGELAGNSDANNLTVTAAKEPLVLALCEDCAGYVFDAFFSLGMEAVEC